MKRLENFYHRPPGFTPLDQCPAIRSPDRRRAVEQLDDLSPRGQPRKLVHRRFPAIGRDNGVMERSLVERQSKRGVEFGGAEFRTGVDLLEENIGAIGRPPGAEALLLGP